MHSIMKIRATQVFWWAFAGVIGAGLGWETYQLIVKAVKWFFVDDPY